MFRGVKKFILISTFSLSIVLPITSVEAFQFSCPQPSQIIIQKNTFLPSYKNPYLWQGPQVNAPVASETYAPLDANKAIGPATSARADYIIGQYDLVCFYPANKTTHKSWDLPPDTGYVFYTYTAQDGSCKLIGKTRFQCE